MKPSLLASSALLSVAASGAAQVPPQFELVAPPVVTSLHLTSSVTVDVDADGDLDLLGPASSGGADVLYLVRNDGNGAFTNVTAVLVLPRIPAVTPLDCDGDGDVDLYLHGYQAGTLLRNDGSGGFTVAGTLSGVGSLGGAAGDLDGDGDVDLALASHWLHGGLNRLLINGGGGTFTAGPSFGFSVLETVALLDLDNDGDLDVFYPSARKLLRNDGGLAFTDVTATQLLVPASPVLSAMAQGDLDGDGDGDFVFGTNVAGVDPVVLHQGSTLVTGGAMPVAPMTRGLALADHDRDGDRDVLRAHTDGTVTLARNDGLGGFSDATGLLPPMPLAFANVHAADVDGDGDPDVLVAVLGTPTLLLRNRDVHLAVGAANVGLPWPVELWSQPGYAVGDGLGVLAVSLARLAAPAPLPPFGTLWLDLNGALLVADTIPQAAGRRAFPFAIPAAPQLAGITLHVQGLVVPATAAAHLTTLGSATIQ
jgi:hypothetical protein